MLRPDYLRSVADEISEIYERLNSAVVADMAKRIVKLGVTRTSAYQFERLQEQGLVYRDIMKRLAEITGRTEASLRRAFNNAGVTSIKYDDEVYRAAGLDPIPIAQSERMLAILTAGIEKTRGALYNLVMTTATQGQAAFIQAADAAYMQTVSGGMAYTRAVSDAVKGLAQNGLSVVNYVGTIDQIDVAVRRAVVTGVNQTAAQMQVARLDEMQCDLVETTAHYGARPTHVPWQGRVFSRSGRHEKYPDFVRSTGFGTGPGLCGWNCSHSFFPYFEGISEPAYSEGDLQAMERRKLRYEGVNEPVYDLAQKQRGMERKIRATKREMVAFDAARNATNDPAMKSALTERFNQSAVKLRKHQQEVASLVKQTGMERQGEREQVAGFGRSQASKATWAARKAQS